MKKFSKKWQGSKNPSKQRKYLANAPIHLKRKLISVNLNKELRKKYDTRNIEVRKNDVVKVMIGKFKGKKVKVIEVKTKQLKIYLEGIQNKKQDGSMANIPFRPSNLQIVELYAEDKKRFKRLKTEISKKEEKSKDRGKSMLTLIKEKKNEKTSKKTKSA